MSEYEIFYGNLKRIFEQDPKLNDLPLKDILDPIPTVEELDGLPRGTVVLLRADLDVPVKEGKVTDNSRIEASYPTMEYCASRGFKVIVLAHKGRDKSETLGPIAEYIKDKGEAPVVFVPHWMDEKESVLLGEFVSRVKEAEAGTVFILENTRRYGIERAMWKLKPEDFDREAERMFSLAQSFGSVARVLVNEAIASSNFDFSSSVMPLVMDKTAMGFYIAREMKEHIMAARKANLVVMSGLKINKLDDLEAILHRKSLKWLILAGSLAMALKKAEAVLNGSDFSIGRAEEDEKEKFFISPERLEQAKRIVLMCRECGVELVLPMDFVLDNGETARSIPPGRCQFDVGPETRELYSKTVGEYMEKSKEAPEPFTSFYNGVFGKFEDPDFEEGTKSFISLLKKMTDSGVQTYVGGGEGRMALMKYGSPEDVVHAFTAGGTILKSLSNRHIPYLKAMYLQNNS